MASFVFTAIRWSSHSCKAQHQSFPAQSRHLVLAWPRELSDADPSLSQFETYSQSDASLSCFSDDGRHDRQTITGLDQPGKMACHQNAGSFGPVLFRCNSRSLGGPDPGQNVAFRNLTAEIDVKASDLSHGRILGFLQPLT
jgi:hypothetical protein